jgi:flagellar biosynthetic protein FliS
VQIMTPAIDRTKLYAQVQIDTSTQPRLICMLHEKCVQLIRVHIDNNSPHQTSNSIQAQNILAQLERSLKQDDEVADGLFYLYDYCYCQLEKADKKSSTSAMSIMSQVRDTFERLSRN